MKKTIFSLLALFLTGAMLFSCMTASAATLESEGYKRKISKVAEDVKISGEFMDAAAGFSFDFFEKVAVSDGRNKLISPVSALYCLGLIRNGTAGDTKAQLEDLLGVSGDELNRSLLAFMDTIENTDKCKVNIANSLWARNEEHRLHLKEEFLQANADWYGAQVYSAPFDQSTVNDINNWCKKETDGMIDRIIDGISSDDVLYLINALSFDAKWQTEYEKDQIRKHDFTGYSGKKVNKDMLFSDEGTYLSLGTAEGFTKAYAGGDYSFAALLPEEGTDVYDFAQSITGESWLTMWEGRKYESVSAGIPEFTFEDGADLKEIMQSLGVTDLFDGGLADLSEMGTSEGGNLYISEVKQKTFIQLDRNGTKAAAITWGIAADECAAAVVDPHVIILDRPFVCAIVDNATGLPLFLGIVAEI